MLTFGALGWVAGSSYAGKHGRPETFPGILHVASVALLAGTLISLALVPVDHHAFAAGVIATVGFSTMAVGMGLATPLMSTLALDLSPAGRQADSGAAIQMSDALGQSIAAGLLGTVFARWFLIDQGTSYLAGFALALILAAVPAVTARRCVDPQLRTADRTGPSWPWPGPRASSAARSHRS